MEQPVSATYMVRPDGLVDVTYASLDSGVLLSMTMPRQAAVDQLLAFAEALGLMVSIPMRRF